MGAVIPWFREKPIHRIIPFINENKQAGLGGGMKKVGEVENWMKLSHTNATTQKQALPRKRQVENT